MLGSWSVSGSAVWQLSGSGFVLNSFSDPDSLSLDPDPDSAFYAEYLLIWIRIQGFDDQKLGKIYSWKNGYFFLLKNCNLLIPNLGLHNRRPSYWRSLQPPKENIQHFKTWNFLTFSYFCGYFLLVWMRICLTSLDRDPIRIWNTGIETTADPKHCYIESRWIPTYLLYFVPPS